MITLGTDETLDNGPGILSRRAELVLRNPYRRDRRALWLAFAIALGAILAIAVAAYFVTAGTGGGVGSAAHKPGAVGRMALPAAIKDSPVIYDTKVMPIAREEAALLNAERPLDVTKVIPALALRISKASAAGTGYAAALRCLTQAVYYEAASEPDEGQRAVAQVVLNRVRHPAFPNTVCGVVYQGSERITGCQFSFTCDGSLARTPSLSGWARAERVARGALSGKVEAAVGNATHYHANYVVPYWAPTLDKAATIGAHIFYLMRGFLGSPRAFSAHYNVELEAPMTLPTSDADGLGDGEAGIFALPSTPELELLPKSSMPAADASSGNLIAGIKPKQIGSSDAAPLRADETRGELKSGANGQLKADEAIQPQQSPTNPAAKPSGQP